MKIDRLLHLLSFLFGSYLIFKYSINSFLMDPVGEDDDYFWKRDISESIEHYSTRLSYKEFLERLQSDKTVLNQFIQLLKVSKHKTYFFETPSVQKSSIDRKFEFVLVAAPSLNNVEAETDTFRQYFNCDNGKSVTTFLNLGGDAMLVAPCPDNKDINIYSSIAPFVRQAPASQIQEFWKTSAEQLLHRINEMVCYFIQFK